MNFFEKLFDFLDPIGGLAKICGTAGAVIGVLFLLFKRVLSKAFLSSLTKQQSYKIIRLIILCSFGIAVLGISIYAFLEISKSKSDYQITQKKDSLNYEPLKLESKGDSLVDSTMKK